MTITLATLPEATAQQVFDQVVAHLRKQGRASRSSDGGRCLYRNYKGLKCAAGCLIGDDEYKPLMDNADDLGDTTWHHLVGNGLVPDTHEELIRDLQIVHDSYEPDQWESQLFKFAKIHKLTYTKGE